MGPGLFLFELSYDDTDISIVHYLQWYWLRDRFWNNMIRSTILSIINNNCIGSLFMHNWWYPIKLKKYVWPNMWDFLFKHALDSPVIINPVVILFMSNAYWAANCYTTFFGILRLLFKYNLYIQHKTVIWLRFA